MHRKKLEFVKAEREQIEMHGSWNNARKFYQKIKHMSEGFKTGASFCKDQDGNLVTDIKSSLDLRHTYMHTYLVRHTYIELGLAIVFLSCLACKPEQT